MSLPPDLGVLCRRLASTPADDLPRFCPLLVSHVLRCGEPLSSSQEAKGKDKLAEAPVLVHRLRTHITTLLTGKSPAGRFAAVCLIKAVVDVGGWESLRSSDPWIRGLIAVLQKPDPLATKELCIVTLTRIFMLLQGYQTLVREMATPTLPSYATACLQLIKPSAESDKPSRTPASVIEAVVCSLSNLVALYPTTMRPFCAQIRSALRGCIAPTSSDALLAPHSLKESARHLFIMLHYTAPKEGSGNDWVKALRASVKDCHSTADQIFRAVHESWKSSTGYISKSVRTDGEPLGGGEAGEELPVWTGLRAGAERLIGLIEYLVEYFQTPTKAAVTIPLGELLDLTARITLIILPASAGSEESVGLNVAIGRDEKAELWSVLPDIHTATMRLHTAIIGRLGESALPLATDILDQIARIFKSDHYLPSVRETTYILTKELLVLSGPTLPRLAVDSATPVIQSCCKDILLAVGHSEDKAPAPATTATLAAAHSGAKFGAAKAKSSNGAGKQNNVTGNADAFLATRAATCPSGAAAVSSLVSSASSLLPFFLSHLPQCHLSPEVRGQVDRTAILSANKDAMIASCLHPYKDSRGRYYPSILPFLVRQFPRDQAVEVLRTNLLRGGVGGRGQTAEAWDPHAELDDLSLDAMDEDEAAAAAAKNQDGERAEEDTAMADDDDGDGEEKEKKPVGFGGWIPQADTAAASVEAAEQPAVVVPMKRKGADHAERVAAVKKRDTRSKTTEAAAAKPATEDGGKDSDSDSDGSVQLDMTLDDDEEDEDDEDDEDR
ncbi:rRNA processing/ribosome biogenesis-domain-containing protein [Podospora didyma]|uniref:Pre-rRNA-processing protein RIX1 n=1 Tax=Podospora didyma TaxID=330526 RepID=A0AAE0KEK0_9PEZI|nr:rRNA processing/ribosome biogenesis-domain-containing protein [Podospora didyma]